MLLPEHQMTLIASAAALWQAQLCRTHQVTRGCILVHPYACSLMHILSCILMHILACILVHPHAFLCIFPHAHPYAYLCSTAQLGPHNMDYPPDTMVRITSGLRCNAFHGHQNGRNHLGVLRSPRRCWWRGSPTTCTGWRPTRPGRTSTPAAAKTVRCPPVHCRSVLANLTFILASTDSAPPGNSNTRIATSLCVCVWADVT